LAAATLKDLAINGGAALHCAMYAINVG